MEDYDFIKGVLGEGMQSNHGLNYGFKLDENYILKYVLRCSYDIYVHMFCTITAKLFLPQSMLEFLLTRNMSISVCHTFSALLRLGELDIWIKG